jgi:hypothetical protein
VAHLARVRCESLDATGENFGHMKSSMANLSVTGASIAAVLAISLAMALEEDDVTLLNQIKKEK